MAISWKGPQHGTPYQEIATACGLAMTCLWEHGADSPGCVGDFGAVLRSGTQAVPYGGWTENPVGTPLPGCPDRADFPRRGDPCGRPGPHHAWWGGRPQADRPTPSKQGFAGPYGPGIFYAEGPAEKLHVIARRSKTDVAISWKGPQHGTPYQEIATACGLAMTCLWEHGADSPDRVDPLRRGDPCGRPGPHHEWWDGRPQADRPTVNAVPRSYGHEKSERESRRDTPPGVSGPRRSFA